MIVQYGGQTPLKLALGLEACWRADHRHQPDMIDAAEDRERFQKLLATWACASRPTHHRRVSRGLEKPPQIGYPLVVRPSYVLGGRAMEIVHEQRDLERYMREGREGEQRFARCCSTASFNDAIECDVDCVRCDPVPDLHRRRDGAHRASRRPFGDSACSLPPYYLKRRHRGRAQAPDRCHG